MGSLSTDPHDRMGVYQSIDHVPGRHRLKQFRSDYRSRDVWVEYLGHLNSRRGNSKRKREQAKRAYENWSQFTDRLGYHYALATPSIIDEWCTELLEAYSPQYACSGYWAVIKRFYDWLMWHADHPHYYQPFLQAASEYTSAERLWEIYVSRPRSDSA